MSYIGQNLPTDVFGGYTTDTFAGDGSATTFTLSQAPFNEQGLIVVINNVIQQPTTNYTVSGTTLTIVGTAVASGDVIYARHTGVALPIGEANALDLQGQSDKLILDADADTTISADTDDQIDFKAGGTDIFQLTATTATFNDGVTITTADNTDTLTLKSTDADAVEGPNLILQRDSGSPADGDDIARIDFDADNDAGEVTRFVTLRGNISDVSDGSEDGQFQIQQMIAGSEVNTIRVKPNEISFNDSSIDLDFRVESDNNAHALFVNGANGYVGIGRSSESGFYEFNVHDPSNAQSFMQFTHSTSGVGEVDGYVVGLSGVNALIINYEAGAQIFYTNQIERMRLSSGGVLSIGTTGTTINSSSFGVVLGNDDLIQVARNAGASSPVLDVYGNAGQFRVMGDGDIENTNNRHSTISDERIKTNITDANSQWDDIKAIEIKNFERKDDVAKYGAGKTVQIGVIAQQAESISPGLVRERDPTAFEINMSSEFGTLYTADDAETKDGNDAVLYVAEDHDVVIGVAKVGDIKTEATHSKKVGDIKEIKDRVKSFSSSILHMKAIKALQEAMAKIETLETKVKALEDA